MSAPPVRGKKGSGSPSAAAAHHGQQGSLLSDPKVIGGAVVAVFVLATLVAVMPDGSDRPNAGLEAWMDSMKIQRKHVQVVCGADECYTVAKGMVPRGDTIMRVPADVIIDQNMIVQKSKYTSLFMHNNGSHVTEFFQNQKSGQGFFNIFIYSFFLAMEKRAGSKSSYYGWFKVLPPKEKMTGALYWPHGVEKCLDKGTQSEVQSLNEAITMMAEAAEVLCEPDMAMCGDVVPTEDEIRYATALYLMYNFQDQAIIPGANFIRYHNTAQSGVFPQFNQEANILDFQSGEGAKRGDEITNMWPRGPNGIMTSRGEFDAGVSGIDGRISLPEGKDKDKLVKNHCYNKYAELMFQSNGRPREALLTCIAVLVADKKQRKKFKNHRQDKEHMRHVYGNLTSPLRSSAELFDELYDGPECNDGSQLAQNIKDYIVFNKRVISENSEYLMDQFKRHGGEFQTQPPMQQMGGDGMMGGNAMPEGIIEQDDAPEMP